VSVHVGTEDPGQQTGHESAARRLSISRRQLLRVGGLAVAAIGLAACGQPASAPSKPAETKPADSKPAEAAKPAAPAAQPAATGKPAEAAKPADTAAQTAPASSASGTIKFWHVWGGDRQPIIEKMIADFQGKQPGIKVEHTVLSQQGMYEKYLTAIAGGDPPDVLMLNTRELPNFAGRGALRGADDLIERDKIDVKATFYPGELSASRFRDKMYGLPLAVGGASYLVFWNKAHFKEAGLDPEKGPKNWTEFADMSKKLTKGSGGAFERIGSLYWVSDGNNWRQWAYSNAGSLFSADGMKVTFDAKENVESLQWVVSNLNEQYGGYEKIRSFATQPGPGGAEGNQSFFQGKISLHLNGVWHFLQLSKEAPQLDYGVGLFPANDKNPAAKQVQIVDGVWNYVIPKGAKNVDAAWELIKYSCAGQGQADFFKAQGRPSVVPKYNEDPEYSRENKFWPVVQEGLKITVAIPVTQVYAEDLKILAQYTEEALVGKRSPEDALKQATLEAQKVHDEKLK
jgi:multiple sugar transport system substrate-binding protein